MSKTEPDANADKIVKSDAAWRRELTTGLRYCINGAALKFSPEDG